MNRILDAFKIFLARSAEQGIVPVFVAWHQREHLYTVALNVHGLCYGLELLYELPSCTVVVETQVVVYIRSDGKHTANLHIGGSAARGDEHAFLGKVRVVPEAIPVYLVESHCVVGTFKPRNAACLLQRLTAEIGYPQALAAVAALGFALVTSATVHLGTASFLQSCNLVRLFGKYKRKGKVGIRQTI